MWNYRIIKNKDDSYGLYEVIYNDDGEISAHSESSEIVGESPEDILQTLRLMLDDANKSYYSILEYDKIKFAPLMDESEKADCVEIALDELYGYEGETKETN
tara:strand:+ start:956 stop:1261 length:306 start_codon:yes stop_codon:yes gene_type:complete